MINDEDRVREHHKLLFHVRRSIRYHSRRQQHYDRWHQFVLFLAVLFGSTSVVALATEVGQEFPLWVRLLPSVLVSACAGLDLVVGSAQKARLHTDFIRQFTSLEQQLVARDGQTEDVMEQVQSTILEIEAGEPPVLKVLDTICQNELQRAMGYPACQEIKVSRWQRFFAQFFDFREQELHRAESA